MLKKNVDYFLYSQIESRERWYEQMSEQIWAQIIEQFSWIERETEVV